MRREDLIKHEYWLEGSPSASPVTVCGPAISQPHPFVYRALRLMSSLLSETAPEVMLIFTTVQKLPGTKMKSANLHQFGDIMRFTYLLPLAFFSSVASANTCEVTVTSADSMRFDTRSITVPADCKDFTVKFEHKGHLPKTGMGHNWVLTQSADMNAVVKAGSGAGIENNFLPQGDDRIIAYTPIIGGGESTSVTFSTSKLSADENYTFFCSFPGHWSMMRGSLKLAS